MQQGCTIDEPRVLDSAEVSEAKIGIFDLSILSIMWLLVLVASIKDFGRGPGYLFLFLNVVMVFRKPANGVVVLLLISFTPVPSLLLPRPFVISCAIAVFAYLAMGRFGRHLGNFVNITLLTITAYVMYTWLTLLIAPDYQLGFSLYQKYLEGLLFVFILFAMITDKASLGMVLKYLTIIAAFALFINFAHYALGTKTALFYIARAVRGAESLKGVESAFVGGKAVSRFLWPGVEPNSYAGQLIFPFSVGLGLYSSVSRRMSKLFWAVMCALIGIGILGTYSRGTMLAAFAVIGMFLLIRNARAIIPGVILLIGALVLFSYLPSVQEHMLGIRSDIATRGGSGRLAFFREAIVYWMTSPLWGHGLGSFMASHGHVTHNGYLQVLADGGVFGLFLFLSFAYTALKACHGIKQYYSDKQAPDVVLSRILVLGQLGVAVRLMTIAPHDMKSLYLVFGLCALFGVLTRNAARKHASDYQYLRLQPSQMF